MNVLGSSCHLCEATEGQESEKTSSAFRMHSPLWGTYFCTQEIKSEESIVLIITFVTSNCVSLNMRIS